MAQKTAWAAMDTAILALLLSSAAALRLIFFNGFFGSDDLVYLNRSVQIAHGIWTSADYNGALRYGYNIPAAFFIYLFGLSPFSANAWTLLCSLGEIGLVYFFSARYLGRSAAVLAALVLVSLPLHIAVGTRIHADSVFAFFLTLTFVLFYMAEESANRPLYFAAGLAMGMIFWVKELGAITYLALATYPLFARRLKPVWLWVAAGGLVMLGGHLILMYILAGDPLHLIKTVTGQLQNSFIEAQRGEDSAGYYFRYLFLDIRHTWIMPFLATLTVVNLALRRNVGDGAARYTAWWLLSLLIVLSFTPVSLHPLRLAMKQSNYLNLFLAPLAMLSGVFLAKLANRPFAHVLIATTLLGSLLLAALEQHSYRVFTANSRAAVAFLQAHPGDWILGSVNNANMSRVSAILEADRTLVVHFGYLARDSETDRIQAPELGLSPLGYTVLDPETMKWGSTPITLDAVPACWHAVEVLQPEFDWAGYRVLREAISLVDELPGSLGEKIRPKLLSYSQPRPATIYRVDIRNLWCGGGKHT